MELPNPYITPEAQPAINELTEEVREKYEADLDGKEALLPGRQLDIYHAPEPFAGILC